MISRFLLAWVIALSVVLAAHAQITNSPIFFFSRPLIGTPQSLGSAGAFAGGGSAITFNYSHAVSNGDTLIACLAFQNAGAASANTSMSDGTNSYTLVESATFGSGNFLNIWIKPNASAVNSGTALTGGLNGAMNGTNAIMMGAWRVAGVISSSPVDAINQGKATSVNNVSIATGTLAQKNEIVGGCGETFSGSASAYSGASGFSNVLSQNATGSALYILGMDYVVVSATTSVTYDPTFNSTGDVYAVLATMKGH